MLLRTVRAAPSWILPMEMKGMSLRCTWCRRYRVPSTSSPGGGCVGLACVGTSTCRQEENLFRFAIQPRAEQKLRDLYVGGKTL